VTFSADRFARRNFDDMIKGVRRKRLAAQYLSASLAALISFHDNEFERMIHCDLKRQFSQPFH
jgi:hypothetical protein